MLDSQYLIDLFREMNKSTFTTDVEYKGEVILCLNSRLLEEKNIDEARLEKIKRAHIALYRTYQKMKKPISNDVQQNLVKRCTRIEYILQDLWGFDRNRLFHNWFEVPGCNCPKSDNRERKGINYQIISEACNLLWRDNESIKKH